MAKMKILIVDDEKQFSDRLTEYLIDSGYEVYSAYTGEEALGILKKQKPDVLLCDLKLSGIGVLDGDDILVQLKSVSPKTTPVIITAYINETTQRNLMNKGAMECLRKPIQLDELESLLEELKETLGRQNKK